MNWLFQRGGAKQNKISKRCVCVCVCARTRVYVFVFVRACVLRWGGGDKGD